MTRAAIAEARAFESWHDYQEALKRTIAPLNEEQLGRQPLPGLLTPGAIAEHLEVTWRFITVCLMRGAPTDTIPEEVLLLQTIWGLLDHDLPHVGELSLLLGADGLPGVEI